MRPSEHFESDAEHQSRLRLDRFHGKCFGPCGTRAEYFSLEPSTRLCKSAQCLHTHWEQKFHNRLLCILPEWKQPIDSSVLPHLLRGHRGWETDIFVRWADQDADFPVDIEQRQSSYAKDRLSTFLPYQEDVLAKLGLRCGNPICFRSKRLQTWVEHQNIFVLDLSTYSWSHTLKDPRMWAAVNVAIEKRCRHLAAWTAGNAGLSLAMLVRAANQFLDPNDRLAAYALHDQDDATMKEDAERVLRCWECQTIRVPPVSHDIFPPETIKKKVKAVANAPQAAWDDNSYMDLTDGWDAVGVIMYRLLFAQVFRYLQPTHVLLPLGTGNLFLGAVLAASDGLDLDSIRIMAVQPAGNNLSQQIEKHSIGKRFPNLTGDPPEAPKIATTYSALLPCVSHAIDTFHNTSLITITRSEQEDAATALFDARFLSRRIRAEPSATVAFAALPHIRTGTIKEAHHGRILVVNSGFGLLGNRERDFMREFWKQ